ncbi:MAG TPA: MFS transporter [Anaerolineales bacterium]|nr:MFS transporter [Anaerolineales bacterium]
MLEAKSTENPMRRVMGLRDFRLLFIGTATSLLGDQFALIATPWLVLQISGDPLALGIVLALEGIPRALFMLVGGAITDRFSPRTIMLIADAIRFVLTGLMAVVVFTGVAQMWMLYAFALAFGLVAGFAIPAGNSFVPMLVDENDLQAGNSIMMGVAQLVGFVGPTIAGIVIGGHSESLAGIGIAFAIDAVSFAVSAVCMWLIRMGGRRAGTANLAGSQESIGAAILTGVRYVWKDEGLRVMFIVMASVNFLIVGPLLVGIPVLADQRLPEGAVAYGLLMSAYAGGNLVGYLLAGALPRPDGKSMRAILLALLTAFGLVIGALAFIYSTWVDFVLLLLLGVGNGYAGITLITGMQTRTPREMLGRMMSLFMLAGTGLVPISQAISGAVSRWNLNLLFVAACLLDLVLVLWTSRQRGLAAFTDHITAEVSVEPAPEG